MGTQKDYIVISLDGALDRITNNLITISASCHQDKGDRSNRHTRSQGEDARAPRRDECPGSHLKPQRRNPTRRTSLSLQRMRHRIPQARRLLSQPQMWQADYLYGLSGITGIDGVTISKLRAIILWIIRILNFFI